MDNLQKAIELTEKELTAAMQKWQEPGGTDSTGAERDIVDLILRLQRLRDAGKMQEEPEDRQMPEKVPVADWPGFYKTYGMPKNYLDIAKYHEAAMFDRVLSGGNDSNGDDIYISAAGRLTDMLNRFELLGMASEEAPECPELPKADKLTRRVHELAEKNNGTIPEGELKEMWAEVCDLYRDEWRLMFKLIDITRVMQTDACRKLAKMTEHLKAVRGEMQLAGRKYGSTDEIVKDNPQITVHLDGEMHQILRHDNDTLQFAFYQPKGEEL